MVEVPFGPDTAKQRTLKVAFIQNRVQRGGRFQVSSEMTRVLNERGIIPDFLCYRNRIDLAEVQRVYGAHLQLNFVNLHEPTLPFEWNIRWFNTAISKQLSQYDLVINSNNTSFGLKTKTQVLSYVHFPRKFRMRSPLRSIHFPEGPMKSWTDWGNDPFKFLHWAYRWDRSIAENDYQVSNSHYTAGCLQEAYGKSFPDVLYPPVNEADFPQEFGEGRDPFSVISLGRFSADKRQLEQIQIAALLPEWRFTIMGFVNEPRYFAQCEDLVKRLGLKNVALIKDASTQERQQALQSASFFLHNLRNEPFGITTVQGIASGCLPIVHNSGGQKEIVPFEDQRFENVEEAAQKLQIWAHHSQEKRAGRMKELQNSLPQYTSQQFREKFSALLDQLLHP